MVKHFLIPNIVVKIKEFQKFLAIFKVIYAENVENYYKPGD